MDLDQRVVLDQDHLLGTRLDSAKRVDRDLQVDLDLQVVDMVEKEEVAVIVLDHLAVEDPVDTVEVDLPAVAMAKAGIEVDQEAVEADLTARC